RRPVGVGRRRAVADAAVAEAPLIAEEVAGVAAAHGGHEADGPARLSAVRTAGADDQWLDRLRDRDPRGIRSDLLAARHGDGGGVGARCGEGVAGELAGAEAAIAEAPAVAERRSRRQRRGDARGEEDLLAHAPAVRSARADRYLAG